MRTHLIVFLVTLAGLWLALAGAAEPREEHERERETVERHDSGVHESEAEEEREVAERFKANKQALLGLIDEANKMQMQYLQSDDLKALAKEGAAWEARAKKFLRSQLAPLYADEFAKARYQGPANIPEGKDAKARALYQRIEARKVALKNHLLELRKPD